MKFLRQRLLLVLAVVALLPAAAKAQCDTCRVAIICNPNCNLIEFCAPARGLLGGFCYEDYYFGCYVTEPCKLVSVDPGLGSPTRLLRPVPTFFSRTSGCS